jgi:hypothetical protein
MNIVQQGILIHILYCYYYNNHSRRHYHHHHHSLGY